MEVVYEDNHLLVVNKAVGELVQADRTGDPSLADTVREWLRVKYDKPGNVFVGVVHRLDRPTSGLVVMAKTSKGLSRMNDLFRRGDVSKTYWAVTCRRPDMPQATLTHYLTPVEANNKTYVSPVPKQGAQKAVLHYRLLASTDRYHLLEVELLTGRKHQIRCQLAAIGCPIKGDLKYGAPRSNPDGGICLQSHHLHFVHPVSKQVVDITAPVPDGQPWQALAEILHMQSSTNTICHD